MKKTFSFDAETNGLWGNPFAIAAIVYDVEEKEIDRISLRLPNSFVTNEWVKLNVLPKMEDIEINCHSYKQMLQEFSAFYLKYKEEADIICHMGYIVEAWLLREMIPYIGEWGAPYPLLDISGHLHAIGEDPTSVDNYIKKYNLSVSEELNTHNPIYDCQAAVIVYFHILKNHILKNEK